MISCVCGCVQLHDYAGDVWGEVSLGVQRRLVDGKHVGEELAERNVRQGLWALSLDYNPLLTHSHACVSGTERAPCREIPTVTQRHLDPLNTHCGGSLQNVVDNFHSSLQSDSKKPLDCRLIEFSDLLEESVTIYCQTISETEELKSLLGSHCSFKRSENCLPFSLETDNSLMVQSTAATAQRNKVYNTTKLKDQLKAHSYLSVGASSVFSVHSWRAWQNISNECTVSGNRWAARHDSGSVCCQSQRVKAKETAEKVWKWVRMWVYAWVCVRACRFKGDPKQRATDRGSFFPCNSSYIYFGAVVGPPFLSLSLCFFPSLTLMHKKTSSFCQNLETGSHRGLNRKEVRL